MDLRCFGKKDKRTWYEKKSISRKDVVALVVGVAIGILAIAVTFSNGTRFYNPFL